MIVSGSASQSLSAALARELEEPLAPVEYDRFPDGELFATVPEIEGRTRAIVVASTVSSDAHLELLLLQDAVREADVDEVVTILPYMGYGRQDEAFESGEPVSARAVARAISTGTDRVLTVNPTSERSVSSSSRRQPRSTRPDGSPIRSRPISSIQFSSRPTRERSPSRRPSGTPTAAVRRTTSRDPTLRHRGRNFAERRRRHRPGRRGRRRHHRDRNDDERGRRRPPRARRRPRLRHLCPPLLAQNAYAKLSSGRRGDIRDGYHRARSQRGLGRTGAGDTPVASDLPPRFTVVDLAWKNVTLLSDIDTLIYVGSSRHPGRPRRSNAAVADRCTELSTRR